MRMTNHQQNFNFTAGGLDFAKKISILFHWMITLYKLDRQRGLKVCRSLSIQWEFQTYKVVFNNSNSLIVDNAKSRS